MSLITPQLDLLEQENPNGPNDFILDSLSTFPQSNFTANGHGPIPTSLDANSELPIDLFVLEDNNGPVSVNHQVNLGSLDYGLDDFIINVSVLDQNGQLKGKGHVRRTAAGGVAKPIESQG